MTQPQGPQQGQQQGGGGQKPGAMTMAMQAVQTQKPAGPKVLRVGVIQKGKIVEERIIRKRETVSIGSSEKNHFVVTAPGLPSRFDLFQLVGNDYILNFTDQMKGRVGLPGGVQDLEQLRQSGGARNAGTHWQVKLGDGSKGKVVIGDVTLLFQFVAPPPVMPRPQLPAAARGGFVKGIDWLFTAFIVFSYMTFFGFIIYLENADWPIEQGIEARLDRASDIIFEEPPPPPEPQETEVTEEPTEEAEEEEVAEKQPSKQPSKETGPPSDDSSPVTAEERARIAEEAAAQAETMLLGALGDSGAIDDVLAGGAVTGNAEDVMAQAGGIGVAEGSGGGELRSRSGGGTGETGGLGGLKKAGGGTGKAVETKTVVERRITGSINVGGGGDIGGTGSFDSSKVAAQIRARQRQIQTCYENNVLKNDPTAGGKVVVQFVIQERGNVTGIKVTQSSGSSDLDGCVTRVIKYLRFNPGPTGGSVTFSYPFVFAPQN